MYCLPSLVVRDAELLVSLGTGLMPGPGSSMVESTGEARCTLCHRYMLAMKRATVAAT